MEIGYYELVYDDIGQISSMEREFFSVPWSEASIGHYAEAGNTIFVVARSSKTLPWKFEDGIRDVREVAGYAAVFCAADEGNLVSIGVRPAYREMGIARELLDICYEMAAARGITSIYLEVRESNEAAIGLYEKEGFELTGKRPRFYRDPVEDALLYTRRLRAPFGEQPISRQLD